MPSLHQVKSFTLVVDRFLHDLVFGIEFAKSEIVGGEFSRQHQLHIAQIGSGGLQRCIRRFYILPHAAKEVDLITERKRNRVQILRVRARLNESRGRSIERPVARSALSRRVGVSRNLREIGGGRNAGQRARLIQAIARRDQCLVCLQQLLFVAIQRVVVENLPPLSLGQGVLRSSRLPRRLGLPRIRRGCGGRRPEVARAHRARRRKKERAQGHKESRSLHRPFSFCCKPWRCSGAFSFCRTFWGCCPCWLGDAAATLTCCPFSSESGGLITT